MPRLLKKLSAPAGLKRFGAHMSIAGGMHLAVERAVEAGCDCFQVFVKNQRQWKARPFTESEISDWKTARRQAGLEPVIAHDTYLINLAAPDNKIWLASVEAFLTETSRCEQLEIPYLVTHPGAHLGQGEEWGLQRVASALDAIHAASSGVKVVTLLEVTAGQGSSLGYRFEHLAEIIRRVREPRRLGVCLDTCHLTAAGYDIVTSAGYAETIEQLDALIGVRLVRCIHANDSKTPRGSRVDRHAHIGEGTLGRTAFKNFINDPRFSGAPMILETPKGTDEKGRDLDKKNLATLRRLIA